MVGRSNNLIDNNMIRTLSNLRMIGQGPSYSHHHIVGNVNFKRTKSSISLIIFLKRDQGLGEICNGIDTIEKYDTIVSYQI